MRRMQARAGLGDDVGGEVEVEKLVVGGEAPGEPRDALACEELHRDEEIVALPTQLEDVDQVRVAQVRDEARLVEEHLDDAALDREVGQDPLDDDRALEAVGPLQASEEDLGHPAAREAPDDLVASYPLRRTSLHRMGWYREIRPRWPRSSAPSPRSRRLRCHPPAVRPHRPMSRRRP